MEIFKVMQGIQDFYGYLQEKFPASCNMRGVGLDRVDITIAPATKNVVEALVHPHLKDIPYTRMECTYVDNKTTIHLYDNGPFFQFMYEFSNELLTRHPSNTYPSYKTLMKLLQMECEKMLEGSHSSYPAHRSAAIRAGMNTHEAARRDQPNHIHVMEIANILFNAPETTMTVSTT